MRTADRDLDQLVLLEAGCAILLLVAIGFAVRLALHPAHLVFEETAAALADHESRTRAVLDAMDEGTLLFARDGSLIDANPSAERILGLVGLAPGALDARARRAHRHRRRDARVRPTSCPPPSRCARACR